MKGDLVVLDRIGGRRVAALLVDGQLEDLLTDPLPVGGPVPGTVLRATVRRRLSGQGAWLVNLPGDGTGHLKGLKGAAEGEAVLVQVTGYPEPGKAIPVSGRISLSGRFAVALPGRDGVFVSRAITDPERRDQLRSIAEEAQAGSGVCAGLVLRTAAEVADDRHIRDELSELLECSGKAVSERSGSSPGIVREADGCHPLAEREWMGREGRGIDDSEGSFDRHGIPDLVIPFTQSRVELPGGGFAVLEQTRAFTAIDVNTGTDVSRGAAMRANIDLSACLPRQLRIRGLGGQFVIDFAPIAKRFRPAVETALANAFAGDRISTTLVGWTGLGHFELHRRRERCSLDRMMFQ